MYLGLDRHAIGGSNGTESKEEGKGCNPGRESHNRPISGAIWKPSTVGDY